MERYSKAREKASWDDDASMLRRSDGVPGELAWREPRFGEKPLAAVTEDDIEAFIRHVAATRSDGDQRTTTSNCSEPSAPGR